MIDLYYWPTPNGWKISIMLEEVELPYRLIPVNIRAGEQSSPWYTAINPNARIPAIVDHVPAVGEPITLFETGAILVYLAEKAGRFLPADFSAHYQVLQWLMWQVSTLGPTLGQTKHFRDFAPGKSAYATERFSAETNRLYHVMDEHLSDQPYLAGDYSIADIGCWPFIAPYERQHQTLDQFPSLRRWSDAILSRPAVRRGLDVGKEWRRGGPLEAHVTKILAT